MAKKPVYEFFNQHSAVITLAIALISLVVGAFGGVPGIVSLWKESQDKPAFSFRIGSLVTGAIGGPEGRVPYILLSGTASNPGRQPLPMLSFGMRIRYKGKEQTLNKVYIPEDFLTGQNSSNMQTIEVDRTSFRDLQRNTTPIPPGQGIHGSMMFLAPELKLEDLQPVPTGIAIDITCGDVFGTTYTCKDLCPKFAQLTKPSGSAALGISIYPKPGKN